MSVDLIPILVDEKVLADEIMRLCKTLLLEKLDSTEHNTHFHDALFFESPSSPNNQYAYANLPYKNTRWSDRANMIRFQLRVTAKESLLSDVTAQRSADALFQFIGSFICNLSAVIPFNEFGLPSSVIISTASARRLHLLFQQINFESLRPTYDRYCKADEAESRGYIKSFEELINYVATFDDLLLQVMEKNKTLYMFAS